MTLTVAIIGCGAVARRFHLPAFRTAGNVDVVAFASATRASAEAAASEWGGGTAYDDWRQAIAADSIDAVDICTPNATHAEIAIAAARSGKHVLVEKPMAPTLEEADAMIAAARDSGVLLVPAQNVRFAPQFVAMRDAVAAGEIGEVVGFRAAFGHRGPRAWAPEADWFLDSKRSGGGALIDLGIHVADLLRFVLADDAVEVAAMLVTPEGGTGGDTKDGATRPGVENAAQVLVRFARGAVGSMHVSWVANPGPEYQLTLFGTTGTMHTDSAAQPEVRREDGVFALSLPAAQTVHAEFARAVTEGRAPSVTAQDGRSALAIVRAAYLAASTGRTVRVGAGE